MADARIDYVELPSATAHELTRAFYSKAFGWTFTDYGPTYSATTNGTTDLGLQGDPAERLRHLIDERYPVYAEADVTVMSRDVPHETIVNEMIEVLAQRFGITHDGVRNAEESAG